VAGHYNVRLSAAGGYDLFFFDVKEKRVWFVDVDSYQEPMALISEADTIRELQAVEEEIRRNRPRTAIRSLRFSPDGGRIASADGEGIRVEEVATGKRIADLRAGRGPVKTVDFSPEGTRLIACGSENVYLWSAADWSRRWDTSAEGPGRPEVARFSPDGKLAATGDRFGKIRLREPETGKAIATPSPSAFRGHAFLSDLEFLADGERIVTAGTDQPDPAKGHIGTVRLWQVQGEGRGQGQVLIRHTKTSTMEIVDVAVDPARKEFAWIAEDGTLGVYDWEGGRPAREGVQMLTKEEEKEKFERAVLWWPASLEYSPGGRWLASGWRNGKAIVWDARTLARVLVVQAHAERPHSRLPLAFSPDGNRLATGGEDGEVKYWDLPK
jgi:WD40 repeat protein